MEQFWQQNGNLILMLLTELIGGIILWMRTGKTTKEEKKAKKIDKAERKFNKDMNRAKRDGEKLAALKKETK